MWWKYTKEEKLGNKRAAFKEISKIGGWHYMHLQYPVLQIPYPFRDRVKMRLVRMWGTYQPCMAFYKDYFRCAYEVGSPTEHENCWDEFQDLKECEHSLKTKIRMIAINRKRHDDGLDFLERPPQYLFHRPHVTFRKETKL